MASQTRITVTLDDDLYSTLQDMAEEEGRGLSDLVRDALGAYVAKEWPTTIKETAEAGIRRGLSNQQTLALVLENHADARTSLDSIAWYRSQMRKVEPSIFTDARARREQEAAKSKPKKK